MTDAKQHDSVRFTFLAEGSAEECLGVVIERGAEMVLEVVDDEGTVTVVGLESGRHYEGRGEVRRGESPRDVVARWANMDRVCVGRWTENGTDYLFSFDLPR